MTKITKICLWVLAFIPLVPDDTIFSPTNSNFFMRSFLIVASLLFLIQFISDKIFRDNIIQKTKKVIKNPLVISVFAFVLISIISTIFAIDKYTAFWGNTERAEGLVGIIYFFSFFVYSLLIFEKKDWLWFFKLSLFTSLILLVKEFFEYFSTGEIYAFVGNSAFLAGYLLFSIFCSFVVFNESENKFFKYFPVAIAILSFLGIFITANRGTILGFTAGSLVILIYGIFKGIDVFYKKLNFRKTSIVLLCLIFIFSVLFISTRKNEIWQKVPGLNRIAAISSEDSTTQTRLLMGKLSLQAINPAQNGLKKFIIGWGPENFSVAYGQYFNPKQFDYEKKWFGRAHNEFFDKLVTIGILGLISVLSIYFFFFKFIFKRPARNAFSVPASNASRSDAGWAGAGGKEFSLLNIGLLFFGTSFFVYLLFLFQQMTTFIPFFAVLAFIVYLNINDDPNKDYKNKLNLTSTPKQNQVSVVIFLTALTIFLSFVFIKNDLPAYIQIRQYDALREESNLVIMSNQIDKVFEPFTTAQTKLRIDLLTFTSDNYDQKNELNVRLYNTAFLRAEEYMKKVPFDIKFLVILAYTYNNQGNNLSNPDHSKLLKIGENYFKKILLLAPNRQDFNYVLALNWFYQGRYIEAFDYFEKIFDNDPTYFSHNNSGGAEAVYFELIKHFYQVRDKDNFIRVAKRLKENNYTDSATLDKIIEYVNKTNIWPIIDFN